MKLKERSGKTSRDPLFQRFLQNGHFARATNKKQNLSRGKDLSHAESKAAIWLALQRREHRVLLGLRSEFGDVGVRNQFIVRFVHRNVAVKAEAENANVNGAIFCEPLRHGFGFETRIAAIAFEAAESGTVDAKRSQKLGLEIVTASSRVSWRGSDPFIDLDDAHFFKELRTASAANGQLFIRTRGSAAGRGAEEKVRSALEFGDNETCRLRAHMRVVVGHLDVHDYRAKEIRIRITG